MNKKITILRGINVGGKRKILMSDLKLLFENLGFTNIATYIQSGNVFFNSDKIDTDIEVSEEIEKAILDKYGFEVPVIVRSRIEIEKSIINNPFYKENEDFVDKLHLTFLKEIPKKENRIKAESFNYECDKFVIKDKDVFILCEGKYHKTKLSNQFFESKLKIAATTRNWKTVLKLLELSK